MNLEGTNIWLGKSELLGYVSNNPFSHDVHELLCRSQEDAVHAYFDLIASDIDALLDNIDREIL